MKRFGINRQRRVDHCLMFDRKTTNTLSPDQRIAMFLTSQPGLSHAADKESCIEVMNRQNQGSSLGVFSKPNNMTTNELMEWKYLLKRRLIEGTLQKRRNAVCSEIERTWFYQGSHLEKHRHNLRVTLELQDRGLMMWWLVTGEPFEDAFPQHRKMNLKKRKQCICFGSIFPLVQFGISFLHCIFMPKNKKKQIVPRPKLNHSMLRARATASDITKKFSELSFCLDTFAVYKLRSVIR